MHACLAPTISRFCMTACANFVCFTNKALSSFAFCCRKHESYIPATLHMTHTLPGINYDESFHTRSGARRSISRRSRHGLRDTLTCRNQGFEGTRKRHLLPSTPFAGQPLPRTRSPGRESSVNIPKPDVQAVIMAFILYRIHSLHDRIVIFVNFESVPLLWRN